MTGVVLFAGGGLACHGLKEAGIDLQLGIEWEADAVTVAQATGLEHVIEGDVRDPELRQRVERPGLLWSSFPCQAWSTAGKRLGAQDERNGWPWTVDWIDQVQPRWFIAENVRGLTFHRGAADCDDGARPQPDACPRCYLEHVILPQLRARFAWVDCRVLNSADFGTPQHRRRLFIVAGPRRISWPAPTHSEGGDLWTKPWRSMGEALGLAERRAIGGGNHTPGKRNPRDLTGEPAPTVPTKLFPNMGGWIESRWPGPSPTVTAQEVKGTRASPGGSFNGGPDRASDALALGTGYAQTVIATSSGVYSASGCAPCISTSPGHTYIGPARPETDRDKTDAGFHREWWVGRRRLKVSEARVLMNAPSCYDAALDLVSKTAAYRILGNGVDRQMARLLALAVLDADKESP